MNLAEEIAKGINTVIHKKNGDVYFSASISKEVFDELINWEQFTKAEQLKEAGE